MRRLRRYPTLWDSVDKENGPVHPALGRCWQWRGSLTQNGYGQFKTGGKNRRPHRLVYEAIVGPIQDGLTLDHLCRNRGCVNPAHLEPVTNKENILRGVGTGAQNARKTHCKRGHEFTPENTYITPSGCRNCRECNRARWPIKRAAARLRKLARVTP